MEKSLKEQNRGPLILVTAANVTGYLAVLGGDWTLAGVARELASIQAMIPASLLATAAGIAVGIANALVNDHSKAQLVFWRWSHPLPGSRAFSKHMHEDDRVDEDALRRHKDPLPTDPAQQNKLWYRWYRDVETDTRIRQVHGQYLFTRDYAGIAVLLALALGPLSFWQLESMRIAGVYCAFLVVQYLLARRAARNHGIRFVTSVLATKGGSDA